METIINRSLFSQLIIAVFTIILSGFITLIIKIYLDIHDKNQYVKLLKMYSPLLGRFLSTVRTYKIISQVEIFFYFILGILFGIGLGIKFAHISPDIFIFIINIDYIRNSLYNLDKLNVMMLFTSCFNIIILLLFIVLILWKIFFSLLHFKILNLLKNNSTTRYFFIWISIGTVIGINIVIYFLLFSILRDYSIINGNLELNLGYFSNVYTNVIENIQFMNFHKWMYLFGGGSSLGLVFALYWDSLNLYNNDIKLIMNSYKSNFPHIKIKTGSGEVEGQLQDVQNKYLVALNEKNVLKIIPWNKIETMEVNNKTEQDHF